MTLIGGPQHGHTFAERSKKVYSMDRQFKAHLYIRIPFTSYMIYTGVSRKFS